MSEAIQMLTRNELCGHRNASFNNRIPCLSPLGFRLSARILATDVSSPSLQKFQLPKRIILIRQNSNTMTAVLLSKQKESRFSIACLFRFIHCVPPLSRLL